MTVLDRIISFSAKKKLVWLATGFLGSIICQLLFSPTNTLMVQTGYDILSFEFAWNTNQMSMIMIAWSGFLDKVILFMVVDMFFPIFYFMILSGWTLLIDYDDLWAKRFILIATGASTCDYVENIASFLVLINPQSFWGGLVFIISSFAALKFALIFLVALVNLVKLLVNLT